MSDKFVDKVKKFMGFEEYEEEFEEEYEEEILNLNQKPVAKPNGKIVNIHTTTQMKVMIHEPQDYDEAASIVDNLKNRKAVVVNLENIEDSEPYKEYISFCKWCSICIRWKYTKGIKGNIYISP